MYDMYLKYNNVADSNLCQLYIDYIIDIHSSQARHLMGDW